MWKPEACTAQTQRIDFTVKNETSHIQQLNFWNEIHLNIHGLFLMRKKGHVSFWEVFLFFFVEERKTHQTQFIIPSGGFLCPETRPEGMFKWKHCCSLLSSELHPHDMTDWSSLQLFGSGSSSVYTSSWLTQKMILPSGWVTPALYTSIFKLPMISSDNTNPVWRGL